ncbi:hypothetical protein QOZ80_1AG0006430 [Eleusine coracana subsp. coracana]|nr:hypothetical protein QOZ80_1AG0006430 [Eleusine coracana subsp. coracana]
MGDDDQQAPQQRYWFPYWTSPAAPASRPGLRPQLSRRDTRPAPPQPQPSVTGSPSRRQPPPAQAATTAATARAAAGAGSPQPQPTRLSSRPSPTRGHPLSPIREPNRDAPPSAPKETTKPQAKPVTPPQPAAHPTKELDIVVPHEKIIHEPPSDTKAHASKAVEKEKDKEKKEHKEKEKDKKEHKEKDKDGKEKDKEKEHKDHKEKEKEHKEKEKEKEHKEKKDKDKHKEEEHGGGKFHKDLKTGVDGMVHKLGASSGHHHDRHASGDGTTVITLAGKNKGASMKISHADRKQLDDGKQKEAQHGAKGVTAFVNSNVQVVNNSLVFQGSVSSSDPGVHLKLSTKSKNKGDDEEVTGGSAAAAAKKK